MKSAAFCDEFAYGRWIASQKLRHLLRTGRVRGWMWKSRPCTRRQLAATRRELYGALKVRK